MGEITTNPPNDSGVTLVRGTYRGATARVHVIPSRGGMIRLGVGRPAAGQGSLVGRVERTLGEVTRDQAQALLDTLTAALDATDENGVQA